MADRYRGWWLEVPGASHSIWSPNLERLQQLIDVTSAEEKSSLAKLGFDGRYIPADMRSASNTQDWLWLESTRRVSWSGVEGRQNPFAIHSPTIPKGDTVHNLMGKASARTQRMSIRGHQNRAQLTAQELIDVLTSVFQVTSLHSSAYYGERPKLHGPSGGGGYESEAWVWAREVEGLASGLYRFDGKNAGLEKYPLKPSLQLNWDHRAARDWGRDFGKPQAIIAVVSDLTILLKKYQRLALHVAMLNAGIRLSECLNTAEEKGLAVCALGGGVMKDIAVNWEGNPNLFVPFAEFAIGGRVPQRIETSS